MNLIVTLRNIQHIEFLQVTIDLDLHGIMAIAGKNGCGKTTLARAIRNIQLADTFTTTAADGIFNVDSTIEYDLDDIRIAFSYDNSIRSLNCRQVIPSSFKHAVSVELSIPFGDRFNFFKSVSDADLDIRKALILRSFTIPSELINFLSSIYGNEKFSDLVEVTIKRSTYYCRNLPNGMYIREDYFSSAEYFLVNLYKRIRSRYRFIFVDEIDISLDAAAQVRLVTELRKLADKYGVKITFTTHSLAMMRTLLPNELYYMETVGNNTQLRPASYNYVKSLLYGFKGWDRYILTEDDVLKEFIEYAISRYCQDTFFSFIVIYIGGSGNVIEMLDQNARDGFLSDAENVIAILDGDQKKYRIARRPLTYCIPFESVEKALYAHYQQPDFSPRLTDDSKAKNAKTLFNEIIRQRLMSQQRIFEYLCNKNEDEMREFAQVIELFLTQ
ncbi:AAA family ATPase [Thiocystis violascens]|uniref:Uncharacterized protein n=1 Tax=Thiocystis violascens (strain ATCC 17096 / DSM 198 / 6111) TaxID=765911 RepID=I3Y9G7_THIV6|nr:AAA family ATPase [Thiocystis violascens]AFL73635.1 hypothetical protein Thivi_1659 [Thiocystis violascens DSM 198]